MRQSEHQRAAWFRMRSSQSFCSVFKGDQRTQGAYPPELFDATHCDSVISVDCRWRRELVAQVDKNFLSTAFILPAETQVPEAPSSQRHRKTFLSRREGRHFDDVHARTHAHIKHTHKDRYAPSIHTHTHTATHTHTDTHSHTHTHTQTHTHIHTGRKVHLFFIT